MAHGGSDVPREAAAKRATMTLFGRARAAVADACGPCPDRASVLRRELLCRCPVALAARQLQAVERQGPGAAALGPAERASLAYQERSLAEDLPPTDGGALVRAADLLREAGHGACCDVGDCLACSALQRLEAAIERSAVEPIAR